MNITRGKIKSGQRVVIYGPEGIGKSTLAAAFPQPVFIDTEGSTGHMDVSRAPKPTSWSALKQSVAALRKDPQGFQTLVIDTADWAERLCEAHIIDTASNPKIKSIEDFGYGKGFTIAAEEFGKLLNYLNDMQEEGWNIVITAHAQIRKFEQPDEIGAYDRWELKLSKKASAMLKEWADAVLFANYKTLVVETESKSKKAQGGRRVLFTTHHPAWDAKNRWGLPDEVPMAFDAIAAHIPTLLNGKAAAAPKPPTPEEELAEVDRKHGVRTPGDSDYERKEREAIDNPAVTAPQPTGTKVPFDNPGGFPTKLWDLMHADGITEEEVRKAVAARGYYPEATPIDRYADDFVDGVLVGNWAKVANLIKTQIRK